MKLRCGHDSTYLKCIECEDPRAKLDLAKSEFKVQWLKDNGEWKDKAEALQAKLEGAKEALLDIFQSVTTTKGTKYAIDIEYVSREALKDIFLKYPNFLCRKT